MIVNQLKPGNVWAVLHGGSAFFNEVTFTGSVADASGLLYMNARYYNPTTARFLSQDSYTGSASVPWTQHLYAYCNNNPVNMVDPTGHMAGRPCTVNINDGGGGRYYPQDPGVTPDPTPAPPTPTPIPGPQPGPSPEITGKTHVDKGSSKSKNQSKFEWGRYTHTDSAYSINAQISPKYYTLLHIVEFEETHYVARSQSKRGVNSTEVPDRQVPFRAGTFSAIYNGTKFSNGAYIGGGFLTLNGEVSTDRHIDQSAAVSLGFDLDNNRTEYLGVSMGVKDMSIFRQTVITAADGTTYMRVRECGINTLMGFAFLYGIMTGDFSCLSGPMKAPVPVY